MSREPCVRGTGILLKLLEAKEQRRSGHLFFFLPGDRKWGFERT